MELKLKNHLVSDQTSFQNNILNNKNINWEDEYRTLLLNQKTYTQKTILNLIQRAKFFLIHSTSNIDFNSLKLCDLHFINLQHLKTFEDYLLKRKKKNEIEANTIKGYIHKVKIFINFLFENKIISFQYKISDKLKATYSVNRNTLDFLEEFKQYLSVRNYSTTTIKKHTTGLKMICIELTKCSNAHIKTLNDCYSISEVTASNYEYFLLQRIVNGEIVRTTAYSYIKTLRLFLEFLHHNKIIDFKYKIPSSFVTKPVLENQYVDDEKILTLVKSIMDNPSNIKYRNLALLLLIVDTGCRPIEASNMKISDISLSSKSIVLHCIKSGQRTMKLNDLVIEALKDYLNFRIKLNPTSDHLFVKLDGYPASNSYLSNVISKENKRAFSNSEVSAKSLRHTYVTNALDNKNNITDISKAMGHKHVQSTFGYVHKSKERLLNNTLSHNPLKIIFDKEMIDYANKNK